VGGALFLAGGFFFVILLMTDDEGAYPVSDCSACHLIAAQGPSEDVVALETDLTGLVFRHPEDIAEKCGGI
jgi:hypothetical protein